MHQVQLTMSVQAPAAAVWSVLSDFGGFLNWVTIEGGKIRLEGEGVGMIRHLTTPLGELGEQLTRHDHETQQNSLRGTDRHESLRSPGDGRGPGRYPMRSDLVRQLHAG